MRIAGEWLVCHDGATRPVVNVNLTGTGGSTCSERFLIDSGADQSVFTAALLTKLGLPTAPAPSGTSLVGIGGNSPFVLVNTAIELTRDDGGQVFVRGDFAAFMDPGAIDLSVLGRDVLNNFDIVLSRRNNEVLLLAGNHQYRIERI